LTKTFSQETFEQKAKAIANKIENITKEEKEALRLEVEGINTELKNGTITQEQADEKKEKVADMHAKAIEDRVEKVEGELEELVQQKVDGKISEQDSTGKHSFSFPGMKFKEKHKHDKECRTTSQFVFAFGLNNLVTDKTVARSDFRYWGSHFYEFGLTYNSRILKNNNLLHAKYGLSLMYNNLRPTENRTFVKNGDQTDLEVSPIHLEDSRFHNVYLVVPLHLEFDFSGNKGDSKSFKMQQGFRLGLGGYAGLKVKSKQILDFEIDGNDVKQRTKGDFNVNDFIYGASAYIGYRDTSLYVKYDISPLFSDNVIDQNNISLGVRFDFN
jgi:hypothetical protein